MHLPHKRFQANLETIKGQDPDAVSSVLVQSSKGYQLRFPLQFNNERFHRVSRGSRWSSGDLAEVTLIIPINKLLFHPKAITEEQLRKADEHTKICSEKSGLEYDVATKFRYAVIGDESEGHQCFARCFFERSGKT